MDVLYFLKDRTRFIGEFYATASEPFSTTIWAIENDEPPYNDPPYSEDGEPPYQHEWEAATKAREVLGRTCISMLAASLHLYFQTWEKILGIEWASNKKRDAAFKQGYLQGYRIAFEEALNGSWDECPADLAILEQVVLVRNRDQHPDRIETFRVEHSARDQAKHPQPFFTTGAERNMLADAESSLPSWMQAAVHVSGDALGTAIEQVELLAIWLEPQMFAAKYPRAPRLEEG